MSDFVYHIVTKGGSLELERLLKVDSNKVKTNSKAVSKEDDHQRPSENIFSIKKPNHDTKKVDEHFDYINHSKINKNKSLQVKCKCIMCKPKLNQQFIYKNEESEETPKQSAIRDYSRVNKNNITEDSQ